MDLAAVRQIVNDNPDGVLVRMIDGTVYHVPHRDYINLGPPPEERSERAGRYRTCFFIWKDEVAHLVNALLVKEIVPLHSNGNGKHRKGKKPSRG